MEVRRLTAGDWAVLRDTRLRALAEAPDVVGAPYGDEARFDDDRWRRFCDAAAWWIATRDERVIGIAAGLRRVEAPDEPELWSVWTDPSARRCGVASLLIRAAVDWAAAGDATTMTMWVTADNAGALRLAAHIGFEPTGERSQLPHRSLIIERMRIVLPATPLPAGS